MKRMLITSLAGFSLLGLGACSQLGGAGHSAVNPQQATALAATTVDGFYVRGRQAQAAGQWRRAADEFRRVLAADPRHLEATNALAVVYAEAGQVEESLTLFRRAIELAPDAAHVHNNYGFALYRLGRLDDAEQALRTAQRLDPGHARTQQNLALLGEARTRVAIAPAAAPDLPAVTTAAPSTVTAAVPLQASAAVDPGLTLVPVEPQVYQLRDNRVAALGGAVTPPGTITAPLPRAAAPLDFAEIVSDGDKALVALRFTPRQLGLEVANGVGVAGLARRTAKQLVRVGMPAVRLTNVARFQETTTVIQYRQGHEAAAQALGGALPIKVSQASSDGLRFDINVRLVLGHDTAGRILAGIEPVPALARTGAGWRWS